MKDRTIGFEGIFNARDLGGLRTKEGDTIVTGCLLRSANLSGATETDKNVLCEKYHIAKVIDLRTGMERSEKPDVVLQDVEYLPIPIFDESIAGISHEKSLNKEQILAALPKMEHLYRQIVTDESCRQRLGEAARGVMEHDFSKGSVLWHCTEGKDRCGILSAILLSALGVEREVIMEDYMLTNAVNEIKAERYYQMLLSAGKTEDEAGMIRDLFLAKESYLEEAFLAIDEEYDNMETFLREGLKIPQASIEKFQKSVLCE